MRIKIRLNEIYLFLEDVWIFFTGAYSSNEYKRKQKNRVASFKLLVHYNLIYIVIHRRTVSLYHNICFKPRLKPD